MARLALHLDADRAADELAAALLRDHRPKRSSRTLLPALHLLPGKQLPLPASHHLLRWHHAVIAAKSATEYPPSLPKITVQTTRKNSYHSARGTLTQRLPASHSTRMTSSHSPSSPPAAPANNIPSKQHLPNGWVEPRIVLITVDTSIFNTTLHLAMTHASGSGQDTSLSDGESYPAPLTSAATRTTAMVAMRIQRTMMPQVPTYLLRRKMREEGATSIG